MKWIRYFGCVLLSLCLIFSPLSVSASDGSLILGSLQIKKTACPLSSKQEWVDALISNGYASDGVSVQSLSKSLNNDYYIMFEYPSTVDGCSKTNYEMVIPWNSPLATVDYFKLNDYGSDNYRITNDFTSRFYGFILITVDNLTGNYSLKHDTFNTTSQREFLKTSKLYSSKPILHTNSQIFLNGVTDFFQVAPSSSLLTLMAVALAEVVNLIPIILVFLVLLWGFYKAWRMLLAVLRGA